MKKSVITASFFVGIGIVALVFVLSQIWPGAISKLFAADVRIGADRPPVQMDGTVKAINDAMMNVSQAVLPTVVSITVDIEKTGGGMGGQFDEHFKEFFKYFGIPEDEQQERYRSKGAGSGVIFTSDGYIVTNNHVVEDAIKGGIKVVTLDKKEYSAELVGRDPLTDLAVLKVNASNLPTAHFGEIQDVKVGEMVLAVGNPLGLNSTVTSGIVSAVGRGRIGGLGGGKSSYSVEHFIQTDAAINPGNSGGGLFDLNGSLVGINTAIATGTGSYIGYGFAIPVDLVKTVIQDIIEDGNIDRGYIGVQIRNVDETDAKTLGLNRVQGVLVTSVIPDGAAKKAGLQSGDVILEVDGQEVSSTNELQSRIVFKRAGDDVKLTVWRDEKIIYKTVKLQPQNQEEDVSMEASPAEPERESNKEPIKFDKLGFSVKPLDKDIKKKYDVEKGVYVDDVTRYGAAEQRGLYRGAVILRADRKDVDSVQRLKDIVNSKKSGETLLLQVKYEDVTQIVTIRVP